MIFFGYMNENKNMCLNLKYFVFNLNYVENMRLIKFKNVKMYKKYCVLAGYLSITIAIKIILNHPKKRIKTKLEQQICS